MRRKRKQMFIWISYRGMYRILLSAATVILLLTLVTYDFSSTRTWTHWTLPLSGKIIAIDAGHGGVDGGAESASGIIEKDITLKISLQVRDYLQQAGALVVMTREDDYDLASPSTSGFSRRKTEDLINRAKLVTKKHADLLITIHLNSVPSARWRGAQTFYYPKREEGRRLATFIQEEIRLNMSNTNRQANTASTLYLLKILPIPTALVEVGFLSNPEEAQLLADEMYQNKLAASIYRGILRYNSGEQIGTP
ncbi:MAG: N-acetylmuramoyl-L-alanine amidase CwlD [Paenibacillaceae bacterium]